MATPVSAAGERLYVESNGQDIVRPVVLEINEALVTPANPMAVAGGANRFLVDNDQDVKELLFRILLAVERLNSTMGGAPTNPDLGALGALNG